MCCIVLQWNCETGLWRPSSGRCCCWESLYSFLAWPLCNWPTTTSVPIRTTVISWFTMAPWGDAWHMLGFDMLGLFCKLALCPHCTIGMKDKFCKELESNLTSSQLFFEFALALPWFQLWSTFLSSSQSFWQVFHLFPPQLNSPQLFSPLLTTAQLFWFLLASSQFFSTHLNSPKFFPTLPHSFHANLLFWTGPHLFSLFFNCGQHFSALLRSSHLFSVLLTSSRLCSWPLLPPTLLKYAHLTSSQLSSTFLMFLTDLNLFLITTISRNLLIILVTLSHFYTEACLHCKHLHASTRRSFCAEKLLHREGFTQRSFFTEKLLTTASFYTDTFLHRDTFTERSFYTQKLVHSRSFCTAKLDLGAKAHSKGRFSGLCALKGVRRENNKRQSCHRMPSCKRH